MRPTRRASRAAAGIAVTLCVLLAGCGATSPKVGPRAATATTASTPTHGCPRAVRLSVGPAVKVGRGVGPLAVDGATVYAARAGAGTVTRLSGAARSVVHVSGTPVDLAAGFGKLWVALRDAGQVVGLDLRSMTQETTTRLPAPVNVTVAADGVWALSLDEDAVWQIALPSGVAGTEIDTPVTAPMAAAMVGDQLWILGAGNGGLSPVNTGLYRITQEGFDLPGRSLAGLSADGSVLWVGEPGRHDLLRVESSPLAVKEIPAPGGMAPIATAARACGVWVASASGTLAFVDARTGRPLAPSLRVGRAIAALAPSGDGVWVSDPVDGTVVPVSARPAA